MASPEKRLPTLTPSAARRPFPVREPPLDLGGVGRPVRHHEAAAVLLIPAEGRNVVVAAVEDPRLARRRLRRRGAVPLHEPVAAAADPGGHPRRQPDPDRVAENRRGQAVDLDDEKAPAAGDPRRLPRREAAGQLGVERVVAIGRDHDRDEGRRDRDDEGGGEGTRERGDLEARHERGGQGQHHRVDHEREQADGRHVQRQGEEDDHRPHEGVEEAEDHGPDERGGDGLDEDPGDDMADDEEYGSLDGPVEEDAPAAADAQPLAGNPDRGRPGVADGAQEAHGAKWYGPARPGRRSRRLGATPRLTLRSRTAPRGVPRASCAATPAVPPPPRRSRAGRPRWCRRRADP